MTNASSLETLRRIREALEAAVSAISTFIPGDVTAEQKSQGRGPVTEADRVSNRVLRDMLLNDGEGWLSEETVDDLGRLEKQRVWVVDPLDGTLEFVAGIPEWCVSVAMVENGRAIAGGICNPVSRETILGSVETGVTYNGERARPSAKAELNGAVVLASRSELKRGEWERFQNGLLEIRPMGSVAYKLALVAAGRADATWTLTPKNEWDVAAGAALVEASGGCVNGLYNTSLSFNNKSPLLSGLIASGPNLRGPITSLLGGHPQSTGSRG